MPEEINRVLTDHISDLLFCPMQTAVDNLAKEGITQGVHLVGDVMLDALEYNKTVAEKKSKILEVLGLKKDKYLVITIHRPSNTDSRENLSNIIKALREIGEAVVFPVHPRTKKFLQEYCLDIPKNLRLIEPLGYLDMLKLMAGARKILTDSGGIQKEAYMLGVPCITLRENTEWVETLGGGWNVLVGAEKGKIIKATRSLAPTGAQWEVFGSEGASKRILQLVQSLNT
jgi:UDP-N-acetylglucosamine 2-epimerase (non-hydrolysing)